MSRRDFGSFFASNVEELISLPENEYCAPDIPIEMPSFTRLEEEKIQFGKEMKQEHFLLEDRYTFINHGAFGAVVKDVIEVAQRWQLYIERQPVRFFDRELLPHLVYITRRMAKFVDCDPADLVLIPNVTTAVNVILRSYPFTPGDDEIMYFSTEYGANKKAVKAICEQRGIAVHEQEVKFPITRKNQITESLIAGLHENTRLLVVDHITSNTAFIMPIKDIIDICHARNVKVLIDGAHALGQLEVNLNAMGCDFYATNCHKWFGACKGVALLYIAKPFQSIIQPMTVSHGYGSGFIAKFSWTGLRDYSVFLALHTALDFWITIGPAKIRDYMCTLAKQAGIMLTKAWDTQIVAPLDMIGSMLCVQLPKALYPSPEHLCYKHAETIQNTLYHKFNIEVPVKVIDDALCVRISAHIYNTMDDYLHLADAVTALKTQLDL